MNTLARTVLLSFFPVILYSQIQISGIINQYAKVNAIEPCEAVLTVADAAGFDAGAKVLIIQMKGASISTSNSGSFGNIEDLGSAGLYEINEILSVFGNEVSLKYELSHSYSPVGLQLVTVPSYGAVVVENTLTARPWDGEMGGVLIFEAENLNLSADINVSGKGFRGAQKQLVASDCNFLTKADEFHYNTTNWRGSPKGEGIAELVQGKEHGRGAQANGGGGGNDHNSGGGGGGNIVNGGIGGKQGTSGFGCDGDYPGRGGKACPNEQGHIYLGGGGGAGHFDDTGAGSSGANGGGIAVILAKTIEGNGFSVLSNGETPATAGGDGAGGGGAGGTILIKSDNLVGSLNITAKGGDGGSVNNTPDRCNGAGGGGSGGRLISNLTTVLIADLSGGMPGVNTVSSGQCNGPSNGAEQGEDGVAQNNFLLSVAHNLIEETLVIQQPTNAIGCVGVQLDFHFNVVGNYLNYQWQFNDGSGWENLTTSTMYTGVKSPYLTIFSPTAGMDGYLFRCSVTNPCNTDLLSTEVELVLVNQMQADFQVSALGNGSYQFQNNSLNGNSFLWDFGDGTTSVEENPAHTYADFGNYIVTLTVFGPCGDDVFSDDLVVAVAPTAGFSFQNTGLCAPQSIQFENLSTANATSFEWYFPGGDPATSNLESPAVTYSAAGFYDAILIAANAVGSDTFTILQGIEIGGLPVVDFGIGVSNLTVTFANLSLNASQGYLWNFGDGNTSDEANPVHTYPSQGIYQVSLTATNECGESTISLQVPTGSLPQAQFSANYLTGCTPFVVQFENQSSGNGLNGFYWEFPGGTPSTSTDQNPTVSYDQAGSYTVMLTATNSLGSHKLEQPGLVNVFQTPTADFNYQTDGYSVSFNNSTVGSTNYSWDFGDGATSQAENPTHDFAGPGVYQVMLTASNLSCGNAIAYQIYLEPLAAGEKTDSQPNVLVYPNPVNDFLNITFKENKNLGGRIKIQNTSGQVLQSIDFQGDSVLLDLSRRPSGIYFIVLSTEDGTVTKQVVKL